MGEERKVTLTLQLSVEGYYHLKKASEALGVSVADLCFDAIGIAASEVCEEVGGWNDEESNGE